MTKNGHFSDSIESKILRVSSENAYLIIGCTSLLINSSSRVGRCVFILSTALFLMSRHRIVDKSIFGSKSVISPKSLLFGGLPSLLTANHIEGGGVATSLLNSTNCRICRGMVSTTQCNCCLLYTSPSPRDRQKSRMPSSA